MTNTTCKKHETIYCGRMVSYNNVGKKGEAMSAEKTLGSFSSAGFKFIHTG